LLAQTGGLAITQPVEEEKHFSVLQDPGTVISRR